MRTWKIEELFAANEHEFSQMEIQAKKIVTANGREFSRMSKKDTEVRSQENAKKRNIFSHEGNEGTRRRNKRKKFSAQSR